MALTGGLFLTLVVLLTLGVFAGSVVVWPRLAANKPQHVAARGGLLLLVSGLSLLTAATQLNAHFLFYADWTDLSSAVTGKVSRSSVSRGATAVEAASRHVPGFAATAATVLPALPSGRRADGVFEVTVTGAISGIVGTIVVQLPPGYTDPANKDVRYPVLETFQGYPGSPYQWIDSMQLQSAVSRAVAAHVMRDAIIVSPQTEIPAGVDTECVNGRSGYPQLETWLTEDVPSWVAHTLRVRTDRASWSTIGFSAGGWCAAMATMLHPAQYGAAIVMGGYFRPEFGPYYEPYPAKSILSRRYDLVALTRRMPPSVALWVETSHSDKVSYTSSAALLAVVHAPLSVKAVVLNHAGHRLSLWQDLLPESLAWLGSSLSGFAPAR